MSLKCLIVDDEPLAADVIEEYIGKVENIEVVAKLEDAIKAFSFLQNNEIDLMFLDIQMPELTGIDFLKTLKNPPKVIITTAYSKYALEGYELDIVDYLMKPISFERFLVAINKYYRLTNNSKITEKEKIKPQKEECIYVKEQKRIVKIVLDEILYIESLRDYIKIKTTSKEVITKQQISRLEKELSSDKFLRVHRSFIIALDKIDAFSHVQVEVMNNKIPVGKNYRQMFLEKLGDIEPM